MFRAGFCLISLAILCTLASRSACADPGDSLGLRLVTIQVGNKLSSFGGQPDRFRQTGVYKAAQNCGVSITTPKHPLVVCSYDNQRMFYLFYNVVTGVPPLENNPAEPYLIQCVKRTITDYPRHGEPVSKVDYLVEAIKTLRGVSKKPDQHYGSFGIRDLEKRKIVKEFMVGQGEIPAVAAAGKWPFDLGILYKSIQHYQPEADAYDKCRFSRAKKWTLVVEFDRYGNYTMKSDELGIEIVFRLPERATQKNDGNRLPAIP